MENPDPTLPSITYILKKISDDKALTLFNSIAVSNGDKYIPLKEMNLTTKQYYSRVSGLLNAGLIKRHKGKKMLVNYPPLLPPFLEPPSPEESSLQPPSSVKSTGEAKAYQGDQYLCFDSSIT